MTSIRDAVLRGLIRDEQVEDWRRSLLCNLDDDHVYGTPAKTSAAPAFLERPTNQQKAALRRLLKASQKRDMNDRLMTTIRDGLLFALTLVLLAGTLLLLFGE